jgi:very-short-patch-repair endonuclease
MPTYSSQSPQGEVHSRNSGMYHGAAIKLFEFAKKLGRNQTETEDILWVRLKNKQLLGYKFRRQHAIDRYIAGFYCHKLKFVIELDGGYHRDPEQTKYDFLRDGEMKEFGILVKRIKNEQILANLEPTLAALSRDFILRAVLLHEEVGK